MLNKLVAIARECNESELELSDEAMKALREAREDIRRGRVHSLAGVKKDLGF